MGLSTLLFKIDGTQKVRIYSLTQKTTIFEGQVFGAPYIDSEVDIMYVTDGIITIEVFE